MKKYVGRALTVAVLLAGAGLPDAQGATPLAQVRAGGEEKLSALSERDRQELDRCVDRALAWLAKQQQPDGSFPSIDTGQPGVTGLCVLAFLARGHTSGEGEYGRVIRSGIAYIRTCQQENGLLARVVPTSDMTVYSATHTAMYNHGIAGLALGECYGLLEGNDSNELHEMIQRAVRFSSEQQQRRKRRSVDLGGWRYAQPRPLEVIDSDLSATSWQLMFLRSARNAGFEVPGKSIDEGLSYIHRCFDDRTGTFMYGLMQPHRVTTRAIAGAGILSLSLAGEHDAIIAHAAGDWVLLHPFDNYNETLWQLERFHYSAFYCSLGMFQLGGHYWAKFFPTLFRTLSQNQAADGSWEKEKGGDERFGNAYTTALCVLALSRPTSCCRSCNDESLGPRDAEGHVSDRTKTIPRLMGIVLSGITFGRSQLR